MSLEKYFLPEQGGKKIPLHLFIAIVSEVRNGSKTEADSKTAIEAYIGETLTTDEASDLTSVFTHIDGGASGFDKSDRSDEIYRILSLAEHGVWYGTQELLRTKLNWI